jgi:hypothetical protein
MPIGLLDTPAEALSLDTLANTVIGIDVQHYILNILKTNVDPTFEAIGGFPLSLKQKILSDVKIFESFNIKPIYVFPGLNTINQLDYLQRTDNLSYEKHLKKSWDSYTNNNGSNINFRCLDNPFLIRSLMDHLITIFQDNDLEFLISPFSQIHQLVYMLEIGIVNSIFTSNDALLFQNLNNFIINIDFNTKIFHFIENKQFISNLNLDFKIFKDLSMTTSNIFQPFQLISNLPNFHTLVQNYHTNQISLFSLINSNDSNKLNYTKGNAVLFYCPVLKINGRVEPSIIENSDSLLSHSIPSNSTGIKELTDLKLPDKLHEVFGNHFPDELWFYQSIGLHIFKLVECLSNQIYIERLPLDMTIDPIYEKIITSNISMKKKEILVDLFTSSLHRYFQHRSLVLKTFYKSTPFSHKIDFKSSSNLNIKKLLVRHTTAKSFDLNSILLDLNDDYLDECFITNSNFSSISSNYELISTSLLRTLACYDFISISTNPVDKLTNFKLSNWGLALNKFIHKYNFDLEKTLLLFLFFQRIQDFELNDSILISKFATLYQIKNFKNINYNGPISRSLLHFNSIMNVLKSELKDFLTGNLIIILFMNQNDIDKFIRDNDDWRSLSSEIPFKSSLPNTISGLIVEKVLDISTDSDSFKDDLNNKLAIFNPYIENPILESLNALKFVNSITDLVDILAEYELVKQNVADKFKNIKSSIEIITSKY